MSESFYLESLSSAPTTAPSSPGSQSQASLFALEPQTPQASLCLTMAGGSVPAFPLLSGAQLNTPAAVPSFGFQQPPASNPALRTALTADTISERRMTPKVLSVKPEDIAAFKEVLKEYQTQNFFAAKAAAAKHAHEKEAHTVAQTFARNH
jgi:hypothetical protein